MFRESPALRDFPVFNPVKVDIDARAAHMRSLGSYKNEVSLSQHELDLIDASVFEEFCEITFESQ